MSIEHSQEDEFWLDLLRISAEEQLKSLEVVILFCDNTQLEPYVGFFDELINKAIKTVRDTKRSTVFQKGLYNFTKLFWILVH